MKMLKKILSLLLVEAITVVSLVCGSVTAGAEDDEYKNVIFKVVKTDGYIGYMMAYDSKLEEKFNNLYSEGKSPLFDIECHIYDQKFYVYSNNDELVVGSKDASAAKISPDIVKNYYDADKMNNIYYLWKNTSSQGKYLLEKVKNQEWYDLTNTVSIFTKTANTRRFPKIS